MVAVTSLILMSAVLMIFFASYFQNNVRKLPMNEISFEWHFTDFNNLQR